jgi:hypothetical protein
MSASGSATGPTWPPKVTTPPEAFCRHSLAVTWLAAAIMAVVAMSLAYFTSLSLWVHSRGHLPGWREVFMMCGRSSCT